MTKNLVINKFSLIYLKVVDKRGISFSSYMKSTQGNSFGRVLTVNLPVSSME